MTGKGCYFLRCLPPGTAVNEKNHNDGEVLFGEVNENSVGTLNTLINNIYKPLVDKLPVDDWGVCETDQKREFAVVFDKFAKELQEALRSLSSNITLEKYPTKHEEQVRNFTGSIRGSGNQDMLDDFKRIFAEWGEKIEAALVETSEQQKVGDTQGPRDELEYWKMRMRNLTCVSEELRSKKCRDVLGVLEATSANEASRHSDSGIYLLLSNWRSIELRVTENLNEAKDNVKYL